MKINFFGPEKTLTKRPCHERISSGRMGTLGRSFLLLALTAGVLGQASAQPWKEGDFEGDTRRPVACSQDAPYNAIGLITLGVFLPNGMSPAKPPQGTGALIGPRHVLTAAHVACPDLPYRDGNGEVKYYRVPLTGDRATRSFRAGLNGHYGRVKRVEVSRVYISSEWERRGGFLKTGIEPTYEWRIDYAILELAEPIQLPTYFGLKAWDADAIRTMKQPARMTGYDGDYGRSSKENGAAYMIDREAPISPLLPYPFFGEDRLVFDGNFRADPGSSGGPLWTFLDGKPIVVGIESGSPKLGGIVQYDVQRGRIITQSLYEKIVAILENVRNREVCDPGPAAKDSGIFKVEPPLPACIVEKRPDGTPYPVPVPTATPGSLCTPPPAPREDASGPTATIDELFENSENPLPMDEKQTDRTRHLRPAPRPAPGPAPDRVPEKR